MLLVLIILTMLTTLCPASLASPTAPLPVRTLPHHPPTPSHQNISAPSPPPQTVVNLVIQDTAFNDIGYLTSSGFGYQWLFANRERDKTLEVPPVAVFTTVLLSPSSSSFFALTSTPLHAMPPAKKEKPLHSLIAGATAGAVEA